MKLTNRQKLLIAHLHNIESRRKMSGKRGFFLEQKDCTSTINSLVVKGVLARSADGRRVEMTERANAVLNGAGTQPRGSGATWAPRG